jgi:hypothetical protein
MKQLSLCLAVLAAALSHPCLAGASAPSQGLEPVQLRCELAEDPLGVDVPHPRLLWQVQSAARGQRQTAYQILAASSASALAKDHADLWDSQKVASDETLDIPYAGAPLRSSQQVFWKVRVWGRDGGASRWSRPATWTMGLLADSDWQGKWISAEGPLAPDRTNGWQTLLLRREFAVRPGLERATLHVCGLGQYELRVNGQKAGDDLLCPGWSKYDRTCLYDTRDLTRLLRTGKNAIGLFLGNGMYNVQGGRYTKFKGSFGPPKAIARLVLCYRDGATETLDTDEHWRAAAGPITFSCIYVGED